MELLTISVRPEDAADASAEAGLIQTGYLRRLDSSLYIIGYVQGLYLLNRAYGASYDALKVSVTLEGQAYPVTEYPVRKHVRTYRIGDHNQVYREVKEYLEGEHYVTYHEVDLDEEKSLQLVCALHFERLGTDLPSGSEFYYANWWFAKDGSPVPNKGGSTSHRLHESE